MVMKTSNSFDASSRSSPFSTPDHPACVTVRMEWPTKSRASCRGRHSSRSIRTGRQRRFGEFKSSDRLISTDRRKRVKEVLESVASFKVVKQILDRDARADEDRDSSEDPRMAVHD